MKRNLLRFIFIGAALIFTGAQCISFGGGGGAAGAGGGVFKSLDKGGQWQQKVALPTAAGVGNFGGANIVTLAFDPQDHLAVYAGTRESGMFYSYDGAESWRKVEDKDVGNSFVAAIAVDPRDKCTIYAAAANRLVKSTDCNRTFEPIYNEGAPLTTLSALTISPFNSAVLYAGTSKGALIKSTDGGNTWSIQATMKSRIVDLLVDSRVATTVYVAVEGRGVWRSTDDGKTFQELSAGMKQIQEAKNVRRLVIDRATPNALVLASKNKISRSTDGGATWTPFSILSPETVEIFSLAVNPKSSKDIYYGTATTFYRSSDGGKNWSADKLPTKRQASALLVDPENSAVIYMGMLEVKK